VIVTIDGQSWYGCRYIGVGQYTKEMDAVGRGANQAGQSYVEERIYCVGGLPKCYGKRQEGKVCFQFQGAEWYVVGYIMAKKILPQFAASHPFGEISSLAHGTFLTARSTMESASPTCAM
jgi:hypothetical protein